MGLFGTISINDTMHKCRNAECRFYLNVVLNFDMLNVVMLSVVAPLPYLNKLKGFTLPFPSTLVCKY
jgi:hypothetical protein